MVSCLPMKCRLLSHLAIVTAIFVISFGSLLSWQITADEGFVRRIVGGQEADSNEWPWMAALISASADSPAGGQFCGGALIHPWWVVTATHCLTAETADSFEVAIGIHDLRNDAPDSYRRVAIQEVYLHPAYETGLDPSIDGDIALLRLAEPVFDVPVLPLVHQYELIRPGVNGTVIGWGLTSDGGEGSEVLLEVELPIVSHEVANATGAYDVDLTADMIPAGFAEGGKDSCQGDSGGPFVVPNENGGWGLAGVVSFGAPAGCAAPNAHGVYASVPYFFNELMALMHAGYEQWRLENNISSILGDTDGDGALDFAEFAFGSDANDPSDRPEIKFVQTAGPGGEIVPGVEFHQARSLKEVSYIVESSLDLENWVSVEGGDLELNQENRRIFKTPDAISSQATQFLRVRVEPSSDAEAPRFFQHAIRLKGMLDQTREFLFRAPETPESITLQYYADQQNFEPKLTVTDEQSGQSLATVTELQEGEIRHTFTTEPGQLYRIQLASVNGQASGPYHFNLPPVEPSEDGEGGQGGLDGFITLGDQVEGVLDESDLVDVGVYGDEYLLTGTNAGDTIRITLAAGNANPDFLPVLVILNAVSFEDVADSYDQENEEVFVTFSPEEGEQYLVLVSNLEDGQRGAYILTVESL